MAAMYAQYPDTFPPNVVSGLAYDGQANLYSLNALDLGSTLRRDFPVTLTPERWVAG